MEPLIRIEQLGYNYTTGAGKTIPALDGIDLQLAPGEYLAIVGANGSGKSTLARHLNALLLPSSGSVHVKGMDTRDLANWREIRRAVAIVFQNPDNQVVATVVEEDVAFGPENLGLPVEELRRRVDWALEVVGLSAQRLRDPLHLSGGQKQRLALAGALAMQPECLVLDEATAMLDPAGRQAARQIVDQLRRQGIAIVAITQDMEEAAAADRVVALAQGRVVLQGPPQQVFADEATLLQLGLELPPMARLARMLHERMLDFPAELVTPEELFAALRAAATPGAGALDSRAQGASGSRRAQGRGVS